MRIGFVFAFILAAFAPFGASAQSMPLLTSDELRAELFGIHIYGHEQVTGLLFDECIDPKGLTVYRTRTDETATPYSEQGQLRVNELAQACFSYPPDGDPQPACFRVFRHKDRYVFQSVGAPDRFIVTHVARGVQDCPNPGEFLS